MRQAEIIEAPALELAGLPYRGPYAEIGGAFGRLHEILLARAMYRDGHFNVAVYFDDVAVTPASQCRGFVGHSIAAGAAIEPPLERLSLPAGPCAVLRYVGPYTELGAVYSWLLGVWLPQSGRTTADAPCYEIYRNTPMDVEPRDLVTDIHLPLI